jgi:hypothetical protein
MSKELVPVSKTMMTTRETLNSNTMRFLSDRDLAKLYQIFVVWKTDPKKIVDLVEAEAKRRHLTPGWIRIMTRFWP